DQFVRIQASALIFSLDPLGDRLISLGRAFPDQLRQAVINAVGENSSDRSSILELLDASEGSWESVRSESSGILSPDRSQRIPDDFITASQNVPLDAIQNSLHGIYRVTRTISG